MIPALASVALSFKQVQSNILKIVKIKEQEKLQNKLDEKDIKIENLIIEHTKETTRMSMEMERKDFEIIQLTKRIVELEKKLS